MLAPYKNYILEIEKKKYLHRYLDYIYLDFGYIYNIWIKL